MYIRSLFEAKKDVSPNRDCNGYDAMNTRIKG